MLGLWSSPLGAKSDADIIRDVRNGRPDALVSVSPPTMQRLHNFNGKYYYLARELGQNAVRSLLGCFRNVEKDTRKICADNLYQLQLTYVHRKALLFYLNREQHVPVRLALQDLLVRINEQRFAAARAAGDANFLGKIAYSEIADFAEKGYPSGQRYTERDFVFLRGGLRNSDLSMRVYAARMMGRISDGGSRITSYLRNFRRRVTEPALLRAIDEALACQNKPSTCPDIQQ